MKLRAVTLLATTAALVVTATACGTSSTTSGDGARPSVVTSFYPIEFATKRIVGDAMEVSVLTKPGAEPHDLEIAAQDLGRMTEASLVIYSKGFQPAVDEATQQVDASRTLDVSKAADLTLTDPHFWLDPQRYAAVARAIGARLGQLDPGHAATYAQNTTAFVAELDALDSELKAGLQSCRIKELVTSHTAFTYLADRYGFEQHGIAGVSPEAEPSAAALKEITDLVRQYGVTTIYQETLVEPHFAETVAQSTGAKVATLDPVEGITAASAGKDYLEVMRSNLAVLREGQACS